MKRTDKKKRGKMSVFSIILLVILAVYVISLTIPLIWGLSTSLKNYYLDFRKNVLGFPDFSAWDKCTIKGEDVWYANYLTVIKNFDFKLRSVFYAGINSDELVTHESTVTIGTAILNTLLYAGIMSVLNALVPCVVGYLCAKYRFKISGVLYTVVVFAMAMPIYGSTPAIITLLRQLGLYDEFMGQWLMSATFANMYFLVFYAFFEGLSDSYLEAAEIDGASQFRVLTTIAIPLAKNTIFTVILIVFVALWNDYNAPILYLPTKPTLAYGIFWLQQRSPKIKSQVTLQVASLMILAIPILIVFIIFKDKLMGNLSLGGVKE
ncbi:MAG: carbohydrate ABC transporter permease [Clostridia bacterium]|nr:carbohydrate ABC transporter permease [Clostridia bacterium]